MKPVLTKVDEEIRFQFALALMRDDPLIYFAYADWWEEKGDLDLAQLIRKEASRVRKRNEAATKQK